MGDVNCTFSNIFVKVRLIDFSKVLFRLTNSKKNMILVSFYRNLRPNNSNPWIVIHVFRNYTGFIVFIIWFCDLSRIGAKLDNHSHTIIIVNP